MEADYNSDSTLDYPGDDDESYCEFNPTVPHPILSLSRVSATPQVIGLDSVSSAATMSKMGELIDTGGNFNMTNSLNTLVNVRRIKPFSIGMAAQESKSSSMCTHRGDFLIPMKDVTIFYTPMFYNAKALDCILSPEFICSASDGMLISWQQSGALDSSHGIVTFLDSRGAEVISLTLDKPNGLYYTSVNTVAVNSPDPSTRIIPDVAMFYHTPDDASDDEVSLDWDEPLSNDNWDPSQSQSQANALPEETPTPKSKQVLADLWQARLGHCSEWQLKVLPLSADGLPTKFEPHPFASYDVYNQARIRKRQAMRGKHPTRAVTAAQRLYMDFGFMRASTFDYSCPDKSQDRVVQFFDGYNSYLVVLDEATKMAWVYLCVSKEPPMHLIHLHLDIFGAESG
jgi:hypothetical protein